MTARSRMAAMIFSSPPPQLGQWAIGNLTVHQSARDRGVAIALSGAYLWAPAFGCLHSGG